MKQIYPNLKTNRTHIKKAIPGIVYSVVGAGRNLRTAFINIGVVFFLQLSGFPVFSQNCATSGTFTLSGNDNTYYPAQANKSLSSGATTIPINKADTRSGIGHSDINVGDILLIIQMQGAQINVPASQTATGYGNNTGSGRGFTTTSLYAGNMEFVVATNAISHTSNGNLNIASGLVNSYKSAPYGTYGQYTYQLILIQPHFDILLNANISAPPWNGSTGGIIVLTATNQINFNGNSISAKGAGFRGGGGMKLSGQSGAGSNDWKFYYSMSPNTYKANGSKGEGIAGTPKYLNDNGSLLTGSVEGYPSGSFARGAPGNAGGGATDNNPVSNDQNAGGGGGGNGGRGGMGGKGWSGNLVSGGIGGDRFTSYASPNRLIMGGGGGAGSTNNGSPDNTGFESSGASGGGIVLVSALSITGTGTIDVSGDDASDNVLQDGSGGGGAGGSILIYAGSGHSGITAIANGGDGGTNNPRGVDATQHGPGGGGGGGVIYSSGTLNASSSVNGGDYGLSIGDDAQDSYGAVVGDIGVLTQTFPFSQLPPNMSICTIVVLPVTITDLNAAYVSSNNVKVSWSTTNEINASYYVVERSTNAEDFIPVGQVNMSQSLNPVHNYNLNDQLYNVNSNIVYYRLRIVDNSGKFSYSRVVPVKLDQQVTGFSLYPNPIDNYTILNLFSDKQSMGVLRVMDNSGRQILTKSIYVNNGSNSIMVDDLGYLPKGIYMVQVLLNNNVYNQKLLKK